MSKTPQKAEAPEPVTQRRRVNRGSTRRITAALGKVEKALDEFTKEMDLQFYEADGKGERVGEWAFVGKLREMRSAIAIEVNGQLYPADEPASE